MSILIKGMTMPNRCFSCPMCDADCCGISRGSYIEYREIEVGTALDTRPDWCPLIKIPPHGDLIDRDALPWENQDFMLTDPDEWGLKAWDIERAPTIIPAEEAE